MNFKTNFLDNYMKEAPIPLAIERYLECRILSKHAFNRPILDIGCGEGMFAFILFAEKIDVGIDPNKSELQRAKEYGMYAELIECYGDKITKPSNFFNTIMSNSVLEHIPSLEPVLQEAHRLLSDQGVFYVTVPTDMFDNYSVIYQFLSSLRLTELAEKYRRFFNRFWRHYNFHNREEWTALFEKNGFKVKEAIEYDSKFVCLMNDFMAPFAFLSFICKKLLNRWIVLPQIRNKYIGLFVWLAEVLVNKFEGKGKGGIIFFALSKQ
ncbi:MAG: class I SAM-dependent methyltransferase [Candidatus Margulisiibacteriota bacterium]